jgi:hypothetical protein
MVEGEVKCDSHGDVGDVTFAPSSCAAKPTETIKKVQVGRPCYSSVVHLISVSR